MEERLPTELRVAAHLRHCIALGLPVYVARRGSSAGTVLLRSSLHGTECRLFNQIRDMDGNLGWMGLYEGAVVEETRADQYVRRATETDPDIWVIEIEGADGRNPFEGKIF
ncbi:MAG: DUF1491 family protein [Pseudomonadota bacterium]